ncbi:MAG: hypothetical protein HN368_22925, partial [Spirochaetales bacterium]|nr:hypothetical protein [Spirochaetales bacterium]
MNPKAAVFFDLYGTLILALEHGNAWKAWQNHLVEYIRTRKDNETAKAAETHLSGFWRAPYVQSPGSSIFESRLA